MRPLMSKIAFVVSSVFSPIIILTPMFLPMNLSAAPRMDDAVKSSDEAPGKKPKTNDEASDLPTASVSGSSENGASGVTAPNKKLNGIILAKNGYIDAVRSRLNLDFPLGPQLPGGINAGFRWKFKDWGGQVDHRSDKLTHFRPIVWPQFTPIHDYWENPGVSVVFLNETYYFLKLTPYYPYANMPRSGVYTLQEVVEWMRIRGVTIPSDYLRCNILANPSGNGILLQGIKKIPGQNAEYTSFMAIMIGDLAAIWQSDRRGVTEISSRWGDRVTFEETIASSSPFYSAKFTNTNNNSESLSMTIEQQGAMSIEFGNPHNEYDNGSIRSQAVIRVVNSFGLSRFDVIGFYNHAGPIYSYGIPSNGLPFWDYIGFYPKKIISEDNAEINFDWGIDNWENLTNDYLLSRDYFPRVSRLSIQYPSGYKEIFETPLGTLDFRSWNPKRCFNDPYVTPPYEDAPRWGVYDSQSKHSGAGVVKYQSSDALGRGMTTLITKVMPKVYRDSNYNYHITEFQHITNIYTYPTLSVDSSTPYRRVRLVHQSCDHTFNIDFKKDLLFWKAAVLRAEEMYGVGAPCSLNPSKSGEELANSIGWDPSDAIILKASYYSDWSFHNWWNPDGNGGYGDPIAKSVLTVDKGDGNNNFLPSKKVQLSQFDGWGFTRKDETVECSGESVTTSLITGQGKWNSTLGILQQESAVMSISGPSLPKLRRNTGNHFVLEEVSKSFDELGRLKLKSIKRGNTVEQTEYFYTGKNPLPVETKKSLSAPGMATQSFGIGEINQYDSILNHYRKLSQTDKLTGVKIDYGYNSNGQLTDVTNVSSGIKTKIGYDLRGRILWESREPIGEFSRTSTQIDRSIDDLITTVTTKWSSESLKKTTEFDGFGRVKTTKNPDESYQYFEYDGWGQLIAKSPIIRSGQNNYGSYRFNYHDGSGRLWREIDQKGRTLKVYSEPYWGTIRDEFGNNISGVILRATDSAGIATTEIRDLIGQRIAVIDGNGQTTRFYYDSRGNMIEVNNGDQKRYYTYNELGWLLSKNEPEEGLSVYKEHTILGTPKLTIKKGRNSGPELSSETIYDQKHRPVEIKLFEGSTVHTRREIEYRNDFSVPVRVVEYQKNGTLTETYGYDALGRYTSKTVGDGTRSFNVSRTFDSLGNLRTLTYPAGPGRSSQTAAWQYDSFLRPVVVKFDSKDRAHMVYDPGTGSRSADSLILGNGSSAIQIFDKGELLESRFTYAGGIDIYPITWSTDGLMLSRGGDQFAYDELKRLKFAKTQGINGESVQQWFQYDRYGNRTVSDYAYVSSPGHAKPDELMAWRASYDPLSNQIPSGSAFSSITPGSSQLGTSSGQRSGMSIFPEAYYDSFGRITSVLAVPGNGQSYTSWVYDPLNRIIGESNSKIGNLKYLLDAEGLRFKSVDNANGKTEYVVYGFNREPLSRFANTVTTQTVEHSTTQYLYAAKIQTVSSQKSRVYYMLPPGFYEPEVEYKMKSSPGSTTKIRVELTSGELFEYAETGNGEWKNVRFAVDYNQSIYDNGALISFESPANDSEFALITALVVTDCQDSQIQWIPQIDDERECFFSGPMAESAYAEYIIKTYSTQTVFGELTWASSSVYAFGSLISEETPEGVFYIHSDQVQSPTLMTDATGKVVSRSKNLPFGERFSFAGTRAFTKRFATHEDRGGFSIYMQARNYLPVYGKFAQPDPLYDQKIYEKDSWNLYSYVSNNPVTRIDPTGQEEPSPHGDQGSQPDPERDDYSSVESPFDFYHMVFDGDPYVTVNARTLYQVVSPEGTVRGTYFSLQRAISKMVSQVVDVMSNANKSPSRTASVSSFDGNNVEVMLKCIEWAVKNSQIVAQLWIKAGVQLGDFEDVVRPANRPMATAMKQAFPIENKRGKLISMGLIFAGVQIDMMQLLGGSLANFASKLGHELQHVIDIKAIGPYNNTIRIAGNDADGLKYWNAVHTNRRMSLNEYKKYWIERESYAIQDRILNELR